MAGMRNHATTLMIAVILALSLKVDTTMAQGEAAGVPPNTEFSQEHGQISACTNNCKDDGMCILQCFKKTLDVMNVDRRSKFMSTDQIHLRRIMCTAGCVVSDICPEVDEAGELSIQVLSVTITISCHEIVYLRRMVFRIMQGSGLFHLSVPPTLPRQGFWGVRGLFIIFHLKAFRNSYQIFEWNSVDTLILLLVFIASISKHIARI